jgi:hypothetical protein
MLFSIAGNSSVSIIEGVQVTVQFSLDGNTWVNEIYKGTNVADTYDANNPAGKTIRYKITITDTQVNSGNAQTLEGSVTAAIQKANMIVTADPFNGYYDGVTRDALYNVKVQYQKTADTREDVVSNVSSLTWTYGSNSGDTSWLSTDGKGKIVGAIYARGDNSDYITYTVTAPIDSGKSVSNFNDASGSFQVYVRPATIKVNVEDKTEQYDGTAKTFAVTSIEWWLNPSGTETYSNQTFTTTNSSIGKYKTYTSVDQFKSETGLSIAYLINGESTGTIKDAGTYSVTIQISYSGNGTSNFRDVDDVTAEYTITPIELTAAVSNNVFDYGSAGEASVVLSEGILNGDNVLFDVVYSQGSETYSKDSNVEGADYTYAELPYDAGTYNITVVSANGNYVVTSYTLRGQAVTSNDGIPQFTINKLHIAAPTISGDVDYTGEHIATTVTIDELFEDYIIVTNSGGITPQEYEVKFELIDSKNYEWSTGGSEAIREYYKINYVKVAKPTGDTATYTYTGSDITYQIASSSAYVIENNVQKDAGTYTVTVKLNDDIGFSWSDGSHEALTFTFEISKKNVDLSTLENVTYSVDAQGKATLALPDGVKDVSNTTYTAGSHELTLALEDPTNYDWPSGYPSAAYTDGDTQTSTISYTVNIAKMKVTKPTNIRTEYDYNGNEIKFDLPDGTGYTITGQTSGTEANTYVVTIALSDSANTEWADGGEASFDITITISAADSASMLWLVILIGVVDLLLVAVAVALILKKKKN